MRVINLFDVLHQKVTESSDQKEQKIEDDQKIKDKKQSQPQALKVNSGVSNGSRSK